MFHNNNLVKIHEQRKLKSFDFFTLFTNCCSDHVDIVLKKTQKCRCVLVPFHHTLGIPLFFYFVIQVSCACAYSYFTSVNQALISTNCLSINWALGDH